MHDDVATYLENLWSVLRRDPYVWNQRWVPSLQAVWLEITASHVAAPPYGGSEQDVVEEALEKTFGQPSTPGDFVDHLTFAVALLRS